MKKNEKKVKGWLNKKINQLDQVPALPEESFDGEGESGLVQDEVTLDSAQVFASYQKSDDTCIGSSAIVQSGIVSEQNVQVDGICKGGVKTDRNVFISGKVEGDVSGESVFIYGGAVQGNVTAKEKLIVNTKAIVIGNLKAEDVEAGGKVKGNIQAENGVYLKGEAVVHGNIKAQAIHTIKGAVINGQVTMVSPKSEKEIFALPVINEGTEEKKEKEKAKEKENEGKAPAKTEEKSEKKD